MPCRPRPDDRSLWKQLRREYEAKGEKPVLYSRRHGCVHQAPLVCDLAAYSCKRGDQEVGEADEKAAKRLHDRGNQ